MKVAIVGSRDFPDLPAVTQYVMNLPDETVVVSGGARGVDKAAEIAARQRDLSVLVFLPDWNAFGNSAGIRRNAQIIEAADRVVAFWDSSSAGTRNSIDRAVKKGKPVEIHYPDGSVSNL